VEIAGQRGTRIKEANRAIDVAISRERFALVETRARLRGAYIAMRLSENHLGFARKREELGRRVYESARARVTAGAASDVELHIAEVEAGRLASDRILAELALADAANDLRLMLNVPVDAGLELTTPLERPGPIAQALAALIDLARARRADLAALEKTHSQLDAALVRLRREVVPSPTLFFDAQQQQPGQTYFGGGIGIPIPLWQRNQGALAITRAEMARNEEEKGLLERGVAVEVANLYRAVFARTQEADLWERDVVPAAEANVDLINQGWRAGKFDMFRVVQASREAGEARRKQLEVMGALWHATIELDRATGTP
jgi:outer membrane protein, heavy metal efflux system